MNRRIASFGTWILASMTLLALPPRSTGATLLNVPDPPLSIVERRVVGCPAGDPLPACPVLPLSEPGFSVQVRDVNNAPVPGVIVVMRFLDPAIRMFVDDRPGTVTNCADHSFRRPTDGNGWVMFAPRIGGSSSFASVEIAVQGVLLANVPVLSTDLDGDGLTGLADFAQVASHFLSHSPDRSTDFDGCVDPVEGATTLADFAIFVSQFAKPPPDAFCP